MNMHDIIPKKISIDYFEIIITKYTYT